MVSDDYHYGLRCPRLTSPHSSGSGRHCVSGWRRTTIFSSGQRFLSFVFLAWENSAKKVTERSEIPFPFCHTPLFAWYSRGPTFFLSSLFLCVSCVLDVYPESAHVGCNRAPVRAWLVYTCTMEAWKAVYTFAWAGIRGAGET